MKLKSKRLIAREFIILSIVMAIGIVTFILIHFYSKFKTNEEETLIKQIEIKTNQLDSLKFNTSISEPLITFDESQIKLLWDFDSKEGRRLPFSDLKELLSNPNERKTYFSQFNSKMEFKDFEEFEDIIQTDKSKIEIHTFRNREDSIKNEKVNDIKLGIDKLNIKKKAVSEDVLSKKQQYNICFWAIFVSALILFFFRYFYYAISWSISIIRKKDGQE